ncbi:hypothetical protein A464_1688 [Salmonella bongori N268-08]|uniref:Uncharacterized protein n=1 Tax=Salmonella bongori N268-08 TaxID=1197719 RepID=S5MW31_SALBN|nr:hypothetical protein A464_1688 [Salmonella bongori N268-08]
MRFINIYWQFFCAFSAKNHHSPRARDTKAKMALEGLC